ncbi:MAG: ABC transporter ATP-binding protein, partial [Christensenellaceae bacterium]
VPFVCLGKITELLVAGEFAFTFGTYGMWLLIAALCWVGHYACHMVSTTISHKATFTVISDVRTNACNKLARMSLGDVLSRPSGEIKNTILERIDSIETTLAHIVPEVSSNAACAHRFVRLHHDIDWRVG